MHKYTVFGVPTENKKELEQIKINAQIIEITLKAYGIYVKMVDVKCLYMYYEYYFEIAVGTNLNRLEKLDREMALALASPTGTIDWLIPVPGRSLIGLRVPKPPDNYLEEVEKKKRLIWKGNSLRQKIAFCFYLLGEFNHYIAYGILKEPKPSKQK